MTRVVFRTFTKGGDVIALFLEDDRDHVSSFQHVGQHGGADYGHVIRATRPATADEIAPLRAELERAPYEYRLRVVQRRQRTRGRS